MRLVKPSFEILTQLDGIGMLKRIEAAGRTCYKSEDSITEDSAKEFVRKIIKRGHHSVLEHESISVRFVIDRGVSHELVRHRLCAFSQESTRYCNYKGGVSFVIPPWVDESEYGFVVTESEVHLAINTEASLATLRWAQAMYEAERSYLGLLEQKWTPQQARSVLPNSLKTEIVTTANLREWRHIFKLRTSKAAHPQIQEVMIPLQQELHKRIPIIFDEEKE